MEIIDNPINTGHFKKGNPGGPGRPAGSKNKRTLANDAINTLTEIGVNPIEVSTKLINELVKNTEMNDKDKISLLQTMTNLWKYQLLTQTEAHKIDEMQEKIIDLTNQNEELITSKQKYFTGTPAELMQELKKQEK